MAMRISTQQAFNNGVAGIQRNYANMLHTQEQINSGSKILTPADDPVASVRLQQLGQQESKLTQYSTNMTAAENSLTQEESVLNSINTVMLRVREIALQAGGGALTADDRNTLAGELRQHEAQLMSFMNTQDARGDYIFAGYQGKSQPFVQNSDSTYSYQGDEGQRFLQIDTSFTIATNDNGKSIFENIPNAGRLDSSFTTSPGSTLEASSPLIEDEIAFASFPSAGIEIKFENSSDPKAYNIYETGGATPLASGSMDNDNTSTDSIVFRGVTIQLDGVPAGNEEIAVNFPSTPRNKQSLLNTVASLRSTLEDGTTSNNQIRDAVAVAVTNIDSAVKNIDLTRGAIGSRLNAIENTQNNNDDLSLLNKSSQSDLRDLDYAEALARLSLQDTLLKAAQQSYVKVNSLSLFDYLS